MAISPGLPYPDFPPRSTETERAPSWAHAVQDRLDVRLVSFGTVRINANWVGPDYYCSQWRVYVNRMAGARLLLPAGGEFPLGPGHGILIPPWIHFDTRCEAPTDHVYLHFQTPGIPDQVIQRVLPAPLDLGPSSRAAQDLQALGDGLVGRADLTLEDRIRAKQVALQALAEAMPRLEDMTRGLITGHFTEASSFRDVVQIIDASPDYPWTVEELARRTHHSADHLTRQLKKHLGITPGDLISERRLMLAARRLITTQEAIEVIAAECGFANRFSFSRSFSRRFGIPPAAYRQRGW